MNIQEKTIWWDISSENIIIWDRRGETIKNKRKSKKKYKIKKSEKCKKSTKMYM